MAQKFKKGQLFGSQNSSNVVHRIYLLLFVSPLAFENVVQSLGDPLPNQMPKRMQLF